MCQRRLMCQKIYGKRVNSAKCVKSTLNVSKVGTLNVSKVGPLNVSKLSTLNISNRRDPLNVNISYAKCENNSHWIDFIKT